MNCSSGVNNSANSQRQKTNQNIQVYVRVRPLNARERGIRSAEVIDVVSPREIMTRHFADSKLTKKFTFDRTFGPDSKQSDVYYTVVAPLIEEVLSGYNCTVFAYGQTGTGKTHTMVGTECAALKSSWEDDSEIGIIPRALSHLFDELRLMELEFSMRISYLELYNEELCDLLSSDDSTKIRIFDDSTKKGSVIIQGLEEIPVHSKDDVYKLLEKGKERRRTATTLMNAQSSRSHTVFSILVHIRENGMDGEEMLKIGKLNLVDLAGSENVSKAGNEKGIRVRETVNINQSLLTLGRVITALVERTPHIPYRESKLTRLLQESLGGRTKTSIIATISPGHKDIEETLSTLEYAHRAKNIQNKPEVNQKLTKKTVLKEYTEEIDKLKRDLMAARDKNGIYLAEETYNELTLKMDSQNRELNEKMLLLKALKDELQNKEKIFNEVSLNLVEKTEELMRTESSLTHTKGELLQTKKVLNTTKRRYKEKQILLKSHVKTEQALTTQATKILEIADLATNDTNQLHNTIERRKDVEIKIQSACEQFTERMRNHFELLDENLDSLQDQHKSHSHLIMEEITNSTKVQNKLLSDAQNKIEYVNRICDNALETTTLANDELITSLENLSEEHKSKLLQLFQELKNRESSLKNEIQINLGVLQAFNEQQKSQIDQMRGNVSALLDLNTADLDENTMHVQKQIKSIEKIAEANLEEIARTQKEIENERTLCGQESSIIEDFVRKMQAIKDQRMKCSQALHTTVEETYQNEKKIIVGLQHSAQQVEKFCQQRRTENQSALRKFNDFATEADSIVDQNVAKCSTLQIQIDNLCHETAMHVDNFKNIECSHSNHGQKLLSDYITNAKRMRFQNKTEVALGCEDIQHLLADDSKRLKGHITKTLAFATSLEHHVRDYASNYKEQIRNCENDLNKFKQSELKVYVPTGTTPSKREYSYPRILAATSPHNKIVNRLRQANDWSDLDTTATIDEDSENEGNTQNDLSDTETILNSTPIEVSGPHDKREKFSHRSSNTLKPPQHKRNSSLNSKVSPLKPSSRNSSPTNLKNNKENVSMN